MASATSEFTTPYAGLPQVIRPDGIYQSQQRFGLYRWHITDPIRFESDLRVTIQALGWRTDEGRAATCRCRTTSPRSPTGTRRCRPAVPQLPDREYLEID